MLREFAPMNAAELFDRAVDVYKKSFWKQMVFAAIVSLISFAAMMFAGVFLAMGLNFAASALFVGTEFVVFPVVIVLVLVPFFLLWQSFSNAGHVLLAKQAFYGHKVKVPHYELPFVALRVLTVLLAQTLLILPFVVFLFLIAYLLIPFWERLLFMPMTAFPVGSLVVFVLLIFVGFFAFTNVFAVAVAVAIFEKIFFFSAIRRAWELIKGEFWKILGVRIMWYLVILAVSSAIQGVFLLANELWFVFSGTVRAGFPMYGPGVLFGVLAAVAPIFTSLAVAPMDGILQTVIYFNQRIKKGENLQVGV